GAIQYDRPGHGRGEPGQANLVTGIFVRGQEQAMSFQQGLSGLNSASSDLDVIGNNVANASTVGFKGSNAQFADVFANSLSGASSVQVGIGSKVAAVAQQFSQGSITSTANPLDIAINGKGFFRLDDNGAINYSRNGQFHFDAQGFIVNDNNLK